MYIYIEIYILVYVFGCTQRGREEGVSLLATQQFSVNRHPKETKNLSLRMVKYNHVHGASIVLTTLKTLLILCKFQHSSLRSILKTDIV